LEAAIRSSTTPCTGLLAALVRLVPASGRGQSCETGSSPRRIVHGTQAVELVDSTATGIVRRIRSARTSRPVTAEDRPRLEQWVLDGVETSGRPAEAKADVRRIVKGWRYATSHEAVGRLLVGADGSVWAEDPSILDDDPRQFLVYDSTGTALARVVLPPRIQALRVSTREILGMWRDADDVPHLRR